MKPTVFMHSNPQHARMELSGKRDGLSLPHHVKNGRQSQGEAEVERERENTREGKRQREEKRDR